MGLLQSLILRHFKLWCCFDTTLCVIAKYGVFNSSVLSLKNHVQSVDPIGVRKSLLAKKGALYWDQGLR